MIFLQINTNYVSYFENYETDLNYIECNFAYINQIIRSHNDLTITIGNASTTSDIMNLTNKELKLKNKVTGEITVYTR